MPMIVIAMMTAATSQPAAIHKPPKTIHSTLRSRLVRGIALILGERAVQTGTDAPYEWGQSGQCSALARDAPVPNDPQRTLLSQRSNQNT
jgi:hypothetical protein